MAKDISQVDWNIRLILADREEAVLAAWRRIFLKRPEVQVEEANPLEVPAAALLCPGNAFGFYDGGFPLQVLEKFGWELQDRTREELAEKYEGELLVGQAVVLPPAESGPTIVYAPVARTRAIQPDLLPVYLAVRGALRALARHNEAHPARACDSIVIPALASGDGELHPFTSARQLRYGYEQAAGLRGAGGKNLSQLHRRALKLASVPGAAEEAGDGDGGDEGES